MKKTVLTTVAFLGLPLIVAAQGNLSNIQQLIVSIGNIIGLLIPITIGLAMLAFFFGLSQYIRSSGEGHKEGKHIMLAGIISLFIMVSIWGIVRFAQSSLGISNEQSIPAPRFPTN